MRNVSIGQIIILLVICFLLFGDLSRLKKKLKVIFKSVFNFFDFNYKNTDRKKGS